MDQWELNIGKNNENMDLYNIKVHALRYDTSYKDLGIIISSNYWNKVSHIILMPYVRKHI